MWGGLFLVEPGAHTGIHHDGEQHTIVYVLSDSSLGSLGQRGEWNATLQASDFLFVPACLPHQELNPSKDVPFQWIVVRSTPEDRRESEGGRAHFGLDGLRAEA